ncbi:uncharacterized protein METZ01_LOCUS39174 [marine metagenome]|uniref:Uncharacterized protein n=1 Tax=marine metagenome TaxID=408172 RepID=A0A381R473_9ZZZZ
MTTRTQEVWPNFSIYHDKETRPNQAKRTIYNEAQIKRKIKHTINFTKVLAC